MRNPFQPESFESTQEMPVDERAFQSRLWTEKNWTIIARYSAAPCVPECDRSKMQKITREDNSHYHVCVKCNTLYEASKK